MNNESGLSLMEVLISMAVLGVGLLGLAPLFVLSIDGNSVSRDVMSVSSLAKERMEMYESMETLPSVPFSNEETGVAGAYDIRTSIIDSTSDTLIPGGFCRLDVTIAWTDKTGELRQASYSSLID